MKPIRSSEITPEHVYISRRDFLKSMGIVSLSAMILAACQGAKRSGRPPQAQIQEEKPRFQGTELMSWVIP